MASKSRRLSGRRLSGKTGGGSSRRLSGLPDPDELENQENSGMGANNDELEMRERRNTKKRNRRRSGRFSLGGRGLKNLLLPAIWPPNPEKNPPNPEKKQNPEKTHSNPERNRPNPEKNPGPTLKKNIFC